MDVLVLCTANICRSPMGEALLRRALDAREVEATVTSAGFLREGLPPAPEVVELMAARDLDITDHRSRTVTAGLLGNVDLLVGMTREHIREAVLLRPALLPRSFTLKELVRRSQELGPRSTDAPADWLLRAQHDRPASAFMGASDEDDVADPFGGRFAAYRSAAGEIEDLIDEFAALAWPT